MDPNPNPPSVEGRNWAELSPDVLSVIFGKIGAVEILMGAGRVCRGWRRVAREPLLWRRVDMTHLDHLGEAEMEAMARLAVDWSAGRMEEFSARALVATSFCCTSRRDDEEELDNTDDCDALGIAKTMHELRQLQLFGNK
ncbi:F-box protein SKIP19, partial [Ananas comosus]